VPRPRSGVRLSGEPNARPARGDASGALDLRELVAESLAAFADELPASAPEAESLYEALAEVSLALAHAALLEARGDRRLAEIVARADASLPAPTWHALLALAHELELDSERPTAVELLAPYANGGMIAGLFRWLGELARRSRQGEDGVVRELGGLHEILLGLAFERLNAPARRLRKSRAWLSPARVLEWPARLRSKRLQRELGLSKHAVDQFGASLSAARTVEQVEASLQRLFDPREPAREAGRIVLRASSVRRHSGAHYTPWSLCVELCERVLAPIVAGLPEPKSAGLLALRVCDPAMGAGAFSLAAAEYLSRALAAAWSTEAADARAPRAPGGDAGGDPDAVLGGAPDDRLASARRAVVRTVICGVDKSRTAVALARLSLGLFASEPPSAVAPRLRRGDALLGPLELPALPAGGRAQTSRAEAYPAEGALDWRAAFPDVFERPEPGFDAVIGNPPWVAYVGRAAQPLEPALAAHYAATNPAFRRYRTLHGLFVYRSAALLRPGGRLGLILPTSVADLDGYAATRSAHDALCQVDPELPDWANGAFDGVFQPCMALLSTRIGAEPLSERAPSALQPSLGLDVWPLRNDALSAVERGLLERLGRLERLPRELFGERGFQTTEDDQAHLRRDRVAPPGRVPLREGADIGEFRALPPQLFGDPMRLGSRLRPASDWHDVKLLIRQTARFPIAALSDGHAFRNSILAGFASATFPAPLLLCLLNSSLIRWLHYTRQRDARQGMPQLKVGHLRALPAPLANTPEARAAWAALAQLGQRLGGDNSGVAPDARSELDRRVSDAYALSRAERDAVSAWASLHPPPTSRRQRLTVESSRPAGLSPREL
jgi:Eco57I restriction-modification methylase